MRDIVWTDEAVSHLEAVVTYVAAFDPAASARFAAKLIEVADSLAEFSDRGRREITTVWPYILRCRVESDTVIILRVRHGARAEDNS